MDCLVTGGAGFIGRHLVLRLSALYPNRIRVLDNFTRVAPAATQLRHDEVEAMRGDIRDMAQLRKAMSGCEVVFHLAAKATVMDCESDPSDAFAVNVGGTISVLDAARAMGVRRVIFASSREVYGEPATLPVREDCALVPKNAYGASKAAAEMYCSSFAAAGLEVTMLRLSNVFGPGDHNRVIPRFIASARAGHALTVYGGAQIVDFVWVDRVVDAFVNAATGAHVAGSVNVASGVGVTILDTARRVLAGVGAEGRLDVLPTREAEVSRFVADVGRATRELGLVRPADPLAELAHLARR